MLAQIAIFTRIDLGARVIEIFIFDKGTKVGREKVIRTRNYIPCQIGVTCATASVDRNSTGYRIYDLDPSRFGIVNADPGAGIRLEPAVFGRNSQNEVKHKGARINPSGRVALCHNIIKWIPQGEIGTAAKAIVEEIAFHRWTNYPRAKDIAELNAAEK